MKVYVDNAATMRMRESAYNALIDSLHDVYGNPASVHAVGVEAYQAVENARKTIAVCIGAKPNEIYFTSGATESNNWAINCGKTKKSIVTTNVEHHSILKGIQGRKYNYIVPVDRSGVVSIKGINLRDAFVSVIYANNEIGTIQPIREIGKICRERGIIFHSDATQSIGHIPINVETDNIDMLSASAHKFGGAKGIGFLYCRKGVKLSSFLFGGSQEYGKRAGTLNVPAIVSMAIALKESVDNMRKESEKILSLRNRLIDELLIIPHSYLNGSKENRLPNNVNIRFDDVEGETLVQMLSARGIMLSSGSACSERKSEASHVLRAIGLTDKQANESIRISLSHENTIDEIDYIVSNIKECVTALRDMVKEMY